MDLKLFVLFLLTGLSESRDIATKQSLYDEFRGYLPSYVWEIPSLSGIYGSLTDCVLSCTRSPYCIGISFPDADAKDAIECTMYKQSYPSTVIYLQLRSSSVYMQNKMVVPNAATLLDLDEVGANCSASSTANASSSCRNLWDDKLVTELGTEWISLHEDSGGWVELRWNGHLPVIAVFFRKRCWKAEQCSRTEIRFNAETSLTVNYGCDEGTDWQDCDTRTFKIARLNQPAITNSITITCLEDCLDAGPDDSWGLQEVRVWIPV